MYLKDNEGGNSMTDAEQMEKMNLRNATFVNED